MTSLVLKRVTAVAFLWLHALYLGARLMFDFLGYTTAPEDFEALQVRLPKVFDWLFSTPWWVPSITMLALTGLVVWVCWPRRIATEPPHTETQVPKPLKEAHLRIAVASHQENATEVMKENIYRWALFGQMGQREGARELVAVSCHLLIVFENEISTNYRSVRFTGDANVLHEVKDLTKRSAFIVFTGDARNSVIDVRFGPDPL